MDDTEVIRQAKLLIALDFLRDNHFADQAAIFEKARLAKPLKWKVYSDESWDADTILGSFEVDFHEAGKWAWRFSPGEPHWQPCDSLADGKAKAEAHWQSLFESMSKGVVE